MAHTGIYVGNYNGRNGLNKQIEGDDIMIHTSAPDLAVVACSIREYLKKPERTFYGALRILIPEQKTTISQ